MGQGSPRILHLFGQLDETPANLRAMQVINAHPGQAEHALVADDRERRAAARRLSKSVRATWPRCPAIAGTKLPGRLLKLAAEMAGYDLVCTYGAATLDAALAHTLFADVHKLAPLVHHEYADGAETGAGLGGTRTRWHRRLALGRAAALVVATRSLETRALGAWDQPRDRVRLIPDGIDTAAFAAAPRRDLLPGLVKRREEAWLGCFADALGDDPASLVHALAELAENWQLVIVGEGADRSSLEAAAQAHGIEDRLHFPAASASTDDRAMFGLFDCLVLPGPATPSASHGLRIIEAMAAGLPLVALRGSEADALVASANGPLLFPLGDRAALTQAVQLATTERERDRIGLANRDKARAEFDQARMIERTWALYNSLIGRGVALATVPAA